MANRHASRPGQHMRVVHTNSVRLSVLPHLGRNRNRSANIAAVRRLYACSGCAVLKFLSFLSVHRRLGMGGICVEIERREIGRGLRPRLMGFGRTAKAGS